MLTTTILFATLPGQSLWRPALQGGVPRYPPKMFGALPFGEKLQRRTHSAGRTHSRVRCARRTHSKVLSSDVCSPTATTQATAPSDGDVHMNVRELALTSCVGVHHEDGVRRATTQVGHNRGARAPHHASAMVSGATPALSGSQKSHR